MDHAGLKFETEAITPWNYFAMGGKAKFG